MCSDEADFKKKNNNTAVLPPSTCIVVFCLDCNSHVIKIILVVPQIMRRGGSSALSDVSHAAMDATSFSC